MSFVILGDRARKRYGLRDKYPSSLRLEYKLYVDSLEYDMMEKVYSNIENDCIVTKTFDLLFTQSNLEKNTDPFKTLEDVIIHFCRIHDSLLKIERLNNKINIIVDMKTPFSVLYI